MSWLRGSVTVSSDSECIYNRTALFALCALFKGGQGEQGSPRDSALLASGSHQLANECLESCPGPPGLTFPKAVSYTIPS
jgi:hypothetical protein